MKIKNIKKSIDQNRMMREDIISTPYGSLIQSFLILNGIDWDDAYFVKQLKKAKLPFLEDENFMQKTLSSVGLKYEDLIGKPLALCKNEFNSIFCPFIVGKEEIVLLPLFSDGRLLRTQQFAIANDSFQIIDWRDELQEPLFV